MDDVIYPRGYKAKPDNEKTDADWEIHEAITDWQQAAFNKHWYECSKFLDASEGGKQTSNDLHLLCQGYALAAARIQALETSLAEAEGRVKDQIVNAIKTHQNFGDEDFGPGLDLAIDIATALETGEWKK